MKPATLPTESPLRQPRIPRIEENSWTEQADKELAIARLLVEFGQADRARRRLERLAGRLSKSSAGRRVATLLKETFNPVERACGMASASDSRALRTTRHEVLAQGRAA
ncbi:MAG: hypothetical protein ACKV0T_01640 [Planctomycetales bacterium]